MVVHDKVYDCTSFVDEHPYVLSLLYIFRLLPVSLSKKTLELCSICSTHSNIPPSNPTFALVWYHKKKESLLPHHTTISTKPTPSNHPSSRPPPLTLSLVVVKK
jgi:hypothetical protein